MRGVAVALVVAGATWWLWPEHRPAQTWASAERSAGGGAERSSAHAASASADAGCTPSSRYRLVATLVVPGPMRSMAVLTDDLSPSRVVAVGGSIGAQRVTDVDRERVVLDHVECVQRARVAAAAPPTPRPKASGPERPLSRSLVQRYLDDPSRIRRDIRARWVGDPPQVQIMRVTHGSPFGRLGLRAGDLLQAIDGRPIRSLNDALEMLDDLLEADQVGVALRRRGRTVEFSVALHD